MAMYLGDKPVKAIAPLLPNEYQEVEYIESTGTQYINTGVIPSSNLNTYMDWEWVGNNSTAYSFAFGSRTSHQQQGYALFIYNAGTNQFGKVAFNYGFADSGFTSETRVRGRHILRIEGGVLYIEDKVVYNLSAQTFTGKYPIIVFSGTNAGAIYSGNAPSKLYNLKLYDSGTLVRDFIPCYRKSDNIIGLYDTVNKSFYTNKGTGTFLKGENKTTTQLFTVPIKKCTGKNLFDISKANKGWIENPTGHIIKQSNDELTSGFIPVKENADYTFTVKHNVTDEHDWYRVMFYYARSRDKKYLISQASQHFNSNFNGFTKTFTVPSGAKYAVASARHIDLTGAQGNVSERYVQFEKGSAETEYEPYTEWYEY